jgi:hypothetical protein
VDGHHHLDAAQAPTTQTHETTAEREETPEMTMIFGQLWDAPICEDAIKVPTPVRIFCLSCAERILAGDRGFLHPTYAERMEPKYVVAGTGSRLLTATHRECQMLHEVGHLVGVCRCTDWDTNSREAALECQRRVDAGDLSRAIREAHAARGVTS